MGVVSYDSHASERRLEAMFPFGTQEGVIVFMENMHHLKELMYFSGDYDALILIIDFQEALSKVHLSESEQIVLDHVFFLDMRKVDVAKMMNVTKQTVHTWILRATEKIAQHYRDTGELYND